MTEDVAPDDHSGGQRRLQFVDDGIEPPSQLQRVGAGLLLNPQDHRRTRVVRALAPSQGRPDLDASEIADEDRPAVPRRDDGLADFIESFRPADAQDQVFLPSGHAESGRRVPVGPGQRFFDLAERDVVGGKQFRSDDGLVLALRAADRRHLGYSGNRQQPAAKPRVRGRPQIEHRVRVGLQRQEQDLAHDRRDRSQHRRLDGVGQRSRDEAELLVDRLPRPVNVFAPIEFGPHDRGADRGDRANPSNSGGAVERRLDGEGNE